MRRIVVTGMGAVTPLAADVETSWSRSIGEVRLFRRWTDKPARCEHRERPMTKPCLYMFSQPIKEMTE